MYRSRNTSAAVYKCLTTEAVDRHNRRISQQASELDRISDMLSFYRNNTYRRSLLVHHSDSRFVRNDAGNRSRRSITRNGYHIQADRTYTSHRFQLLNGQVTTSCMLICVRPDSEMVNPIKIFCKNFFKMIDFSDFG